MKRVFFEKDNYKDYLFVIIDHEKELDQVYKVDNFTDETGREYVYTLIGERKNLTTDKLKEHVIHQTNGQYINFNEGGYVETSTACLESMINSQQLNKEQDIFIYVRNKG